MYNLVCGDKENSSIIKLIIKNQPRAEEIKKEMNLNIVAEYIFRKELDDFIIRNITATLSLGDELENPISKDKADILFFALCVNAYGKSVKITNWLQAKTIYEFYGNDYSKVEIEESKAVKRFSELLAEHSQFFPGYFVKWKLPMAYFKSQGVNYVSLSSLPYCLLCIDDKEYQIPKKIYIKFFEKDILKGRIVRETKEEIKEAFDKTNADALKLVLSYIGALAIPKYKQIKIPFGNAYVEDFKLKVYPHHSFSLTPEYQYWEQEGANKFVLLPKIDYIPLKLEDMEYTTLMILNQ